MSSHQVTAEATSAWSGGASPYATNSKKFGMWLFIISDALTFSALLMTYTYLRLSTPNWPMPLFPQAQTVPSSLRARL